MKSKTWTKNIAYTLVTVFCISGVAIIVRAQTASCADCGSGTEYVDDGNGCSYECDGVPQCVGSTDQDLCQFNNPPKLETINCGPADYYFCGSILGINEQFNTCYTWYFPIPCGG
jgi:hypothetical protein